MPKTKGKPGRIDLRTGLRDQAADANVKIFAPEWVKKALEELSKKIFSGKKEIIFDIFDENNKKIGEHKFKDPLSLRDLQLLARNDKVNVDGKVDFSKFSGIKTEDVVALKDLVKQCVIVGKDQVVKYGGYPPTKGPATALPKPQDIIVCDLAGLQFQAEHNCGRLCLVFPDPAKNPKKGSLDDVIFQNIVGEKQKSYTECTSPRYIDITFRGDSCKFDTFAYQQMVKQDFILASRAIAAQAKGDQIDFRFAKYGAGFFASELGSLPTATQDFIEKQIVAGITAAIEYLAKNNPDVFKNIKQITLPFYKEVPDLAQLSPEARKVLKDNGVQFVNPARDLLAPEAGSKLKIAVTNCGDPHASLGNEMHYGSVDAAVGENIASKGAIFSPVLNTAMAEQTLSFQAAPVKADVKATAGVDPPPPPPVPPASSAKDELLKKNPALNEEGKNRITKFKSDPYDPAVMIEVEKDKKKVLIPDAGKQAKAIWDAQIKDRIAAGKKVAILYAANNNQAKKLLAGQVAGVISGGGQAEPFKRLANDYIAGKHEDQGLESQL